MQQVIGDAPGADADHGHDSRPAIGAASAGPVIESHCPDSGDQADDQREFGHDSRHPFFMFGFYWSTRRLNSVPALKNGNLLPFTTTFSPVFGLRPV